MDDSSASSGGGSCTVYSEQLILSLLTHINVTQQRIEALARLALRHLPQAQETWSAIRKSFVLAATPQSLADLDGVKNRSLWCLVDALLKHASYVFAPLVSPRLLEYITQQTPLRLMSSSTTSASALMLFGSNVDVRAGYRDEAEEAQRSASWRWWETLVFSWEPYLPSDVFAPVRNFVTQRRSTAELDDALASATVATSLTGGGRGMPGYGSAGSAEDRVGRNAPATPADMQLLKDEWEALRYLCVNEGSGAASKLSFEELLASVAATAPERADGGDATEERGGVGEGRSDQQRGSSRLARTAAAGSESDSSGEEAEDDYSPEFVAGTKPRQLPDLGLPAQRRRREARRRPREDDY